MLHVFYRACALENQRPRPSFYSKALCLRSCLQAFTLLSEARFVLIHDGPIRHDLRVLAEPCGEIVELPSVGEAQSFIFALQEAAKCASGDLIYFVEDDYIHLREALLKLVECYKEVPCEYITLFDDPLRYKLSDDVPPDLPLPQDTLYVSTTHHWRTIESTTLTFAGKARIIKEDAEIFSQHVLRRAHDKRYIADRESWRQLQGLGSFSATSPKRKLVGAIPSLAAHCEVTALSPTIDWNRLAEEIKSNDLSEELAIYGGRPAKQTPPLPMMPGALELGKPEQRAVLEVVHSQCLGRYVSPWATKSYVEILEHRFKEFTASPYCLAVSSGTAALHCALVGLGVGPGDEVIVPAYTWMGSATAVCLAGAVPIIADVDETLNLDPLDVERRITPYTRAIMVVHMRGAPARMRALQDVATKHNLLIIEDVAQAMGASFQEQKLGRFGNAGCFSLQTYKIITTGEGGLVLMQNEEVYHRARSLHGTPPHLVDEPYIMLSTNYKMSELNGAVGVTQLDRLDGMLQKMRWAKSLIYDELRDIALHRAITLREIVDPQGDAAVSATIFAETPQTADLISDALIAENIGNYRLYRPGIPDYHLYLHWVPIMNQRSHNPHGGPWQLAQREIRYTANMCPRAVDLLSRAIDINVYPQFTERELQETIVGLRKVLNKLA